MSRSRNSQRGSGNSGYQKISLDEFAVEMRLTMQGIGTRIDGLEERQKQMEKSHELTRTTDWKLWLTIVAMIAGSVSWSWTQIRSSTQQSLVPIGQDIGYAKQERDLLRSKILEESGDRKDDFERLADELAERRDWMTKVTESLALHDERIRSTQSNVERVLEMIEARSMSSAGRASRSGSGAE